MHTVNTVTGSGVLESQFHSCTSKNGTQKIKINLASIGDARNTSTWSGTPNNILRQLDQDMRLGNVFNTDLKNKKLIKAATFLSKTIYGFRSNYYRSFPFRYLRSLKLITKLRKSDSRHTLHFSTYDFPASKSKDQFHYLYCDTTWNLWSNNMLEGSQFTRKMMQHLEKQEQKCLQMADHIFPISEYVKNNIIEHYKIAPEKVTAVGTGLGKIIPFSGSKDYSNHKILFVAKGRFEDKGGPEVLEAFAKAVKINPALSLTIVGQDKVVNELEVPNVTIYGFVEQDFLQKLFETHSVFLMPAVNEPWGLVYLEALACKMPVIGLNRNAFPQISGNGKYGYILNNSKVEEIAGLLLELFNDGKALEEKGEAGQQYCLKNFNWASTVNKIINTIDAKCKRK